MEFSPTGLQSMAAAILISESALNASGFVRHNFLVQFPASPLEISVATILECRPLMDQFKRLGGPVAVVALVFMIGMLKGNVSPSVFITCVQSVGDVGRPELPELLRATYFEARSALRRRGLSHAVPQHCL